MDPAAASAAEKKSDVAMETETTENPAATTTTKSTDSVKAATTADPSIGRKTTDDNQGAEPSGTPSSSTATSTTGDEATAKSKGTSAASSAKTAEGAAPVAGRLKAPPPGSADLDATTSAATDPNGDHGVKSLKKGARKKRKTAAAATASTSSAALDEEPVDDAPVRKRVKVKRPKKDDPEAGGGTKALKKKSRPPVGGKKAALAASAAGYGEHGLSAAQIAVNEQMRRALEEDQYSANGSIIDTDSEDDDHQFNYKGQSVRLDRAYLLQVARKHNWMGGTRHGPDTLKQGGGAGALNGGKACVDKEGFLDDEDDDDEEEILHSTSSGIIDGVACSDKSSGGKKNGKVNKKAKSNKTVGRNEDEHIVRKEDTNLSNDNAGISLGDDAPMEFDRDEGSIFGQTTGASNSTWVECDKCKKWRRLRGVVDERKLPPKWYCSMNKNDPERARCSAPEEEYDAPQTAESAADSRTRKHLRVWVRRLQVNEQYESRLPTLTRGKKRSVATSSKEPFEWVRCCNPSCGKWRAVLRIMDAKQNVADRALDGEWYCVMNTWDEKTASCAAPQENLPAVGLPPWCLVDES